eukprot:CAMPEP_0172774936 /NCGR_PEP_ID=MMETSP1074-20121228/197080_1 /TAXON_ID=2916 /ORGANISM="Ceratium fusus, Strain PA161109" /LENGTH=72 /DNA_ID=CAMNT_0013611455 /DNA_START=60 /DNA_END=275 /DNA_ORIENTATION=+
MSASAGTSSKRQGTSATSHPVAAVTEPMTMFSDVGESPEFGGVVAPTVATPGPLLRGCPSSPLLSIRCPSTQ